MATILQVLLGFFAVLAVVTAHPQFMKFKLGQDYHLSIPFAGDRSIKLPKIAKGIFASPILNVEKKPHSDVDPELNTKRPYEINTYQRSTDDDLLEIEENIILNDYTTQSDLSTEATTETDTTTDIWTTTEDYDEDVSYRLSPQVVATLLG